LRIRALIMPASMTQDRLMDKKAIAWASFKHPLEALAMNSLVASQEHFAREARRAVRDTEDVRFEASSDGLRICAADEDALASAALMLRRVYGGSVQVAAPAVRLMPGPPIREPVMSIRVSTRGDYNAMVRHELRSRGARLLEECSASRLFVVRGEAPLTRVLGLSAKLRLLTNNTSVHWIRLSHYAALPADPEPTAA
jgi:elongation factor G-like protein